MYVEAVESAAPPRHLKPAALARCIGELPSLPSAFIAAVEALSQDDAPASTCIEAIERDQALTVRLLRLANSAFYGAQGQVASVGDAVQMLGLRTVASTLAAISLRATFGSVRCEGFCFDTYWRHTLCTAISARELARIVSLDPGEAFLLGLLHDVGKLILAMTSPELEAQALRLCAAEGIALHEAEQRVLGVSHAEVGATVASQWNFPATLVAAIAAHHIPTPLPTAERLDFSHLVLLANHMAHGLEGIAATDVEGDADVELLRDPMWSALGASEQQLRRLTQRVVSELAVMSSA